MKIGIIGAGKLGTVLGQLALKAGYQVLIAGSAAPEKIELTVAVLLPGAVAVTTQQAARQADLIILALPLSHYQQLDKTDFAGKVVIDATNYWQPTDGLLAEILHPGLTSSQQIQRHLADSQIIKALNHIGYHELLEAARPQGAPDRKAIAIAGDQPTALAIVKQFVDSLGFDPLVIGPLVQGKLLQPGSPAFGADVTKAELKAILATYADKIG
ncbi:NADPH-dependent F420 reductase [Liquorilactobacillus vini]|uniref:NADP oxidoreductase coenzyme F420-dependent n=1 Tax=Liquorilactobacillus vini DSM 20605 TaxID=1133569 RepID=A0A0R2C156_9LACO|nr:NAD(P)-binding domain-containing protein [Liquorilactobacillus vini]KRM85214.1 NADP oxidoreductase coenzyme F420-dependent [Liquorilactobacillus vini DSM 20605]